MPWHELNKDFFIGVLAGIATLLVAFYIWTILPSGQPRPGPEVLIPLGEVALYAEPSQRALVAHVREPLCVQKRLPQKDSYIMRVTYREASAYVVDANYRLEPAGARCP